MDFGGARAVLLNYVGVMRLFVDFCAICALLIAHVPAREDDQRLHLPLPRRERARGRRDQAADHQEPRPQGGGAGAAASSTAWPPRWPALPSGRWCWRSSRTAIPDGLACRRIGAPLLFGRLWQETGCQAVIEELLGGRAFEFPVERAVFTATLHRLMVSGSDRACEKWLADYAIPGARWPGAAPLLPRHGLAGRGLPEAEQAGATPFAPRCVKDLIEERLFARRRDLFSELTVVFMDTTSLSFVGAGGETLGRRGHSKDHRPELMQMILGVVIDAEGRPVCTEMWPGNTADVSVLLPVVDRLRDALRHRPGLRRRRPRHDQRSPPSPPSRSAGSSTCSAPASAPTAWCARSCSRTAGPSRRLCVPRAGGGETQLWVKEVVVEGRRYIVCRNEAEADKDAADRQAVLAGLERQLKQGDKALIGNSAYRRFLRRTHGQERPFEIDPGKVADEARFDGIFVLRTNARITPLAGGAALSRPAPGRGSVPHGQGALAHPADLPLLRRRHPRPRVLLVPGPGAAARSSTTAATPPASAPNGATCCATSTGSRRSSSPRTASA